MSTRTHTKTSHKIHRQPYQLGYLPWRRIGELTGAFVLFAIGFSVLVQVAYPGSLALPNTKIAGQSYGFKSREAILGSIAELNGQVLQLKTGSQTHSYMPEQVGVTIDGTKDVEAVMNYSLAERMVPFSLFFEKRSDEFISYHVNDQKARSFVSTLKKHDKEPKNAAVKLKGTEVIVEKAEYGYSFDAERAFAALRQMNLTRDMTLTLDPKLTEPNIPDTLALEAAAILQNRLSVPLTVEVEGHWQTFDTQTLASWATLKADGKKYRLSYDSKKIEKSLGELAERVYIAPVVDNSRVHDGRLLDAGNSKPGRAIDMKDAIKVISAAARTNQSKVQLKAMAVAPVEGAIYTFTRSSKGIQALLDHWVKTHSGQWGIVMHQLNGSISASVNPNQQFYGASLYKNYVAYVVYTKVHKGQIKMKSDAGNGQSVATCLEVMIVRSDNPCAHALGNKIGWGANDGMLAAKGFGSTSLNSFATTARDSARFMDYVYSKTLTGTAYDKELMSKFDRQIWRAGIPAGSPGMRVANKVGWINGYTHDAAIVFHPKGAYVLTVLSYGSNFGTISQLAAQISGVMSQ